VSSVIVTWLLAIVTEIAVAQMFWGGSKEREESPLSYRALVSYGSRLYPASITGYFNYRIDTFIIQALMVASSGPLGLYNMAVTMAELLFYVPDSVTMIFLPRVSGATPDEADAFLPRVARLNMLLTCLGAAGLIPVAYIGIHLVLPKFAPCLPAFYVLLPGVLSISLAKVLTSYLAGRGRPGPVSVGATVAVVANVVANFILIPRFRNHWRVRGLADLIHVACPADARGVLPSFASLAARDRRARQGGGADSPVGGPALDRTPAGADRRAPPRRSPGRRRWRDPWRKPVVSGRVLVVTYYFPPVGAIGVQRTLKYVTYLPRWAGSPS